MQELSNSIVFDKISSLSDNAGLFFIQRIWISVRSGIQLVRMESDPIIKGPPLGLDPQTSCFIKIIAVVVNEPKEMISIQ